MDTSLSKGRISLVVFSHLVGWILFVYVTMPLLDKRAEVASSPLFPWFFVVCYLFLIVYFYFNIHVFVLRFLSKKKIILFLGITAVAYFLYCFVIPWVLREYFFPEPPPFRHGMKPIPPDFRLQGGSRIAMSEIARHIGFYSRSSQFLVVFIVGTGLKVVSQWYAEKRRLQDLEKSMIQAELSFLKSQIHPHFLFNSLNSIYYLALSKDDKAPEAIISLSDFLRFVTTESNNSRIPLEKEVKMLEEYIHLQSLRASEKFELQFKVKRDLQNSSIMPLTFIPFVENAFKYGISAHVDCFIHIGIEVEDNILKFTCDNSIVLGMNERNHSEGIGLENIRKRLNLTYPGQHSLTTGADSLAFHVELQVNLA